MQLQNTQRHEPRGSSWRRATGCSQRRNADPQLHAGPPERACPTSSTLKVDIEPAELTALGLNQRRRQQHAVDRLGRALRQRLHRPRPGEARLRPGRRAVSRRRPRTSTNGMSAIADGEMAPFSSFAQTGWATAPVSLSRFQGVPSYRVPGPAGAGRQLGRGDGPRSSELAARDPRHRASPGRASPIRNGCRRARRRCSTPSRCWSCSCALPRSTKAGRSRSRCCWSSRWAWSARSSR